MKKLVGTLLVLVAVALAVFLNLKMSAPTPVPESDDAEEIVVDEAEAEEASVRSPEIAAVFNDGEAEGEESENETEAEEPPSEEELLAAAEEAKVEAFDQLTDRWMEPKEAGVTMSEIDGFAKAFAALPSDRQDESIHRALNLIPDENVMLLAGVLMDKSANPEIVEAIFNDILNRDEEVKKPIMKEIFKDKSHPCWSDAAWILDATGEIEKP